MFKFIKIFIINIFIISVTSGAFAENNVAYIDLDTVFFKSNSGKSILEQLNNLEKNTIEDFTSKEKKLKIEENQILSSKNLISKEEFKKKINNFKKTIQIYNMSKSSSLDNFKNKKNNEISRFLDFINPLIKTYMKENSIKILIDKKNIYIADSNYDITPQIISIIDKKIDNYNIE